MSFESNLQKEIEDISKLYYSCTECSAPIDLISFNEDNCNMEFKCLNSESHGKKTLDIKEYFDKIKNKQYENENDFKDKCIIHNSNNYSSFCFDCNQHLCKICLKGRTHIKHNKNQIIEIQPIQEELDIIQKVIQNYKTNLESLKKEQEIKENEIKDLLKNDIINENLNVEKRIEFNKIRQLKELESNNKQFISDIEIIKKEYENKIKIIKNKFNNNINNINNKYKLITENVHLYSQYKIEKMNNEYNGKKKI